MLGTEFSWCAVLQVKDLRSYIIYSSSVNQGTINPELRLNLQKAISFWQMNMKVSLQANDLQILQVSY